MADAPDEDWDDPWGLDNDWLDDVLDGPPLYAEGRLAAMTAAELCSEWERQCNRHDAAVDRCEAINSPTIEDAAARMRAVEAEQAQRGLETGPSHEFLA